MGGVSLITRVCCEAVRSAILATAWLLVIFDVSTEASLGLRLQRPIVLIIGKESKDTMPIAIVCSK